MHRLISWLILGFLTVTWLAVVGLPFVATLFETLVHLNEALATIERSPVFSFVEADGYLAASFGWAIGIGTLSLLLAIPAGFALANVSRGRTVGPLLLAPCVATVCLPAYMSYWSLGMLRLPGSPIGMLLRNGPSWAHDAATVAQVAIGLSLWCWPIAALCVAGSARQIPRTRVDLLDIDAVGFVRRIGLLLLEVRRGIFIGWFLSGLAALSASVVYDLASTQTSVVRTYSEVLRRLHAETWNDAAVFLASLPMLALMLLMAVVVAVLLRPKTDSEPPGIPPVGIPFRGIGWLAPVISLGLPVSIMIFELGGFSAIRVIAATDGRIMLTTMFLAALAGTMIAIIAISTAYGWSVEGSRSHWIRIVLDIQAIGWLWTALLPGTTVGAALVMTYNSPTFEFIYNSPAMIVLGYLARFGFVGILIGRWTAHGWLQHARPLARLDGVDDFVPWLQAAGPDVVRVSFGVGLLSGLLSLSEIATTVIVTPAGYQSAAERLLNRLHYAREDAAMAASLLLILVVLAASGLAIFLLQPILRSGSTRPGSIARFVRSSNRWSMLLIALLSVVIAGTGCDRSSDDRQSNLSAESDHQTGGPAEADVAANAWRVFGSTGRRDGEFVYPRAMAIDEARDRMYIIDRTGRIQLFDLEGRHRQTWLLPLFERGFPTGMTVHPETGHLVVADTHNHRVLVFSPDGELIDSFGEYGMEPGQFVFPTDIAFGPQGEIIVSEYGGNDRIQVFDAAFAFMREFGEFGRDREGVFSRPQSIYFDPTRNELWIADSCNHRIVITDLAGQTWRKIGEYGVDEGTFCYPYGITPLPDGTLLITEFGNNRLQRIDRDGRPITIIGTFGEAAGEFNCPWTAAWVNGTLFVLDSRNNRVQVRPLEL